MLISFSCKDKVTKDEPSKEKEITLSSKEGDVDDTSSSENMEDCDDFIDNYEEWSEEYVAFLSKYKDNPMKAVTSPEYAEMMQKASAWSQQWLSLSISCAQNSSYEEKVNEITEKMDAKVKELGF